MKKFIFGLVFLILLILVVLVGYGFLQADYEVKIVDDALILQLEREEYYTCYGYTLEDANVIVDPYGISPLSALIVFETDNDEEVVVSILDKDGEVDFSYLASSGRSHYVVIYGLYENYYNKVRLKVGDKVKEFVIETKDILFDYNEDVDWDNGWKYGNIDGNSYAVDDEGNLRWYLEGYYGNYTDLGNGHFLLGMKEKYDYNSSLGIVEIDYLGKVYSEYLIDGGFDYRSVLVDGKIYVLSDNKIMVISKQSGDIFNGVSLKDDFFNIGYDEDSNLIYVSNEIVTKYLDIDTLEVVYEVSDSRIIDSWFLDKKDIISFNLGEGRVYGSLGKTKVSDKNISLFSYDELGDNYNISIFEEREQLVVLGDFDNSSYIILDNGFSKLVYKIDYDEGEFYKYIHKEGISGKYSIYFKIGDELYSTNRYIDW